MIYIFPSFHSLGFVKLCYLNSSFNSVRILDFYRNNLETSWVKHLILGLDGGVRNPNRGSQRWETDMKLFWYGSVL